jgi:peptidoglycan/LPS O-acetylase OafA/YrhL
VLLVVVFHLWPDRLTGGYVGVDVFFAISGYLITGHLLREAASTGRIDLPSFWARRIRRLLPAAALVLAVSLAATVAFLPSRVWQETAYQIGASAIGLQNWALAANSVDYFGSTTAPSIVQHYWSLSLEEQFYVVWPVLMVAALAISAGMSAIGRARLLGATMAIVFSASLVWSIVATNASKSSAYFSTFTHAWEFALGGLLALAHGRLMAGWWGASPRLRAITTWLGLLAIVVSAFVFSGETAFPGWVALVPVLGTIGVIAAASSTSRIQRPLLLESRPVQFVGGASYSTYLWHWPPIVVLPAVLGHELGFATKIAILVLSVLAGWLTKILVEDPARTSVALNHRRWITYTIAASTAAVLVTSSLVVSNVGQVRAAEIQARAQETIESSLGGANACFGASAMLHDCPYSHRVDPKFGPDFAADDWGSIAGVTKDGTMPDKSACIDFTVPSASADSDAFLDCAVGQAGGEQTMAIVGDSHALALTEPLVRIAEAQGWSVRVFLRNSCTPSLPMLYDTPTTKQDCNLWRAAVAERIAADPAIDVVVATGFTRGEPEAVFTGTRDQLLAGYADLWASWLDAGKRVVAIGDVPLTSGDSVPDCVAAHTGELDPCTVARADALAWDPVGVAAASDSRVSFVDLTDAFCDEELCHSVIGGLIAYRDPHHLSATFGLTLIPWLERGLSL